MFGDVWYVVSQDYEVRMLTEVYRPTHKLPGGGTSSVLVVGLSNDGGSSYAPYGVYVNAFRGRDEAISVANARRMEEVRRLERKLQVLNSINYDNVPEPKAPEDMNLKERLVARQKHFEQLARDAFLVSNGESFAVENIGTKVFILSYRRRSGYTPSIDYRFNTDLLEDTDANILATLRNVVVDIELSEWRIKDADHDKLSDKALDAVNRLCRVLETGEYAGLDQEKVLKAFTRFLDSFILSCPDHSVLDSLH